MKYVLDACSVLAVFFNEPGFQKVINIISNPHNECHIHQINASEVLYIAFKKVPNEAILRNAYNFFGSNRINIDNFTNSSSIIEVAKLKQGPRISLADCIGLQY